MKNNAVEDWFQATDHPLADVMQYIRDVILKADPRIEETIKWKSPSFMFKGNIASFNPRTKKHVSLMFHYGASIPGDFPSLEGTGDVTRYLKISNMDEAKATKDELIRIIQAWCAMKEQ